MLCCEKTTSQRKLEPAFTCRTFVDLLLQLSFVGIGTEVALSMALKKKKKEKEGREK